MGLLQVELIQAQLMAIKRYTSLPKVQGLEPHPQMQFSVLTMALVEVQSSYFTAQPTEQFKNHLIILNW